VAEEDNFIFEYTPGEQDEEEEAEDLQSISPDEWGEDYDDDDEDGEGAEFFWEDDVNPETDKD
jgi:hypothetical protein